MSIIIDNENAEDLINQVDSKYGRKSKELYLQILELFSKYSGNNADTCRKIFEEISSLFGLEKSSRIIWSYCHVSRLVLS